MIYHHAGCEATFISFMCKYINTMPRQIGGSKKCLRCIVMSCRFTLDKPLHCDGHVTSDLLKSLGTSDWKSPIFLSSLPGKIRTPNLIDSRNMNVAIHMAINSIALDAERPQYLLHNYQYIIIYSIAMLSVYLSCMCAYQLIIVYNIV